MAIVSFLSFGGCKTMVLLRHMNCTWELDWTSGQILFCVLSASSCLCSADESFDLLPEREGINRCIMARFTLLVQSGPDLSLPEYMLLQHFYTGLDKESAHHLHITSWESFAHLTPTVEREILDKILDRTSFVCVHEPPSTEPEVRHEEVPAIESEQLERQFVDSTPEPSPELKSETPK